MYYSVIVFLIFWATVGGSQSVGVFREDSQGCLKLHPPATWRDARDKCFLEGGVVASPENDVLLEAMTSALQEKAKDTAYIYTGIHNTYSNRHFYTLEGTPLASLPVPTEDFNQVSADTHVSNETCLSMHRNGMLVYNNCTDVLPYFCFKRIDPSFPICGCDEDGYKYESRTKRCYKFYPEYHAWSEAFGICSDDGGHLAVINGDTEADTLRSFYANAKNQTGYYHEVAFLGFKELGGHEDRLWMTIHGQSLEKAGYNKFHAGQPESKESTCGAMYPSGDLLDDFYCDRPRGFICEKAPVNGRTDHPVGSTNYFSNVVV